MPIPDIPEHDYSLDGLSDREKLMRQSEWLVETCNYKDIGEALASFSQLVGAYEFVGTAEVKLEGAFRKFELILYFDESQRFQCAICSRVPDRPTSDNPGICTLCGQKVCSTCWKKHTLGHWRPPIKTLGGKEIPF